MAIDITFLGTSQAVPTAKRNHTSILVRYNNEMILVDCGEGTQRQFRIARINPCKLTRILITHWHGDHVFGIPGLLQTLALNGYNKTLYVYGPKGTKKFMDMIYQLFVFSGKIDVRVEEVTKGEFIDAKDFVVEAFPVSHSTYCLAYSFREKDKRRMDVSKIKKFGLKGEIIGKLQQGKSVSCENKLIRPDDVSYTKKGKKVAFLLDTEMCENCINAAKDADLLISEATYSSEIERKAAEYKHLTSENAAEIAKRAKAKNLILTHISQRYEKEDEKILKEAKKVFPKTELARDFMKVVV
jgi:ribonuclease Z